MTRPSVLAEADLPALGRRIRELRAQRGLTQPHVAGDDISVAYLSRIEAGQRRPDAKVLDAIARRLGTTVDELLGGPPKPQVDEALLDIRFAEMALASGDAAAAVRLEQTLATEPPLPVEVRARALWTLAGAREALGDYAGAVRLLEDLAAAPGGRNPIDISVARCRCYREAGSLQQAIDIALAASRDADANGLGDTDEAIQLLVTMAAAYHERGDTVVAQNLCIEAVARAERTDSPTARVAAYWNASIVAKEAGDPSALPLADKALAILSEQNDAQRLARLRLQIGILLVATPDTDLRRAERELKTARRALAATGAGAASLSRCDASLALARLAAGDQDKAWDLALAARDEAQGAPLALAHAEAALGRIALARRERPEARRRFAAAVAALTGAAADREAAQLWFELGAALDDVGDAEAARDAYRSAAAATGLRVPSPSQALTRS